jgi:hypothetical protein
MAIYSEFSHEKRWCSIVMLVYQRVNCGNIGCVTHAHISMICHGYILENVATMVWRQILVPKNWIWSFIPCQIDQEKTNILIISGYDRVLCVCASLFGRFFVCTPAGKVSQYTTSLTASGSSWTSWVSLSDQSRTDGRTSMSNPQGMYPRKWIRTPCAPVFFFKGGFHKWGYPKMVGI